MIPDPIEDIRALLLAASSVTALVDDRVYHSELPPAQSASMPEQAVVLALAGGGGRPKLTKIRRLRLDTICYGATLYESQQLHAAVREVLEAFTRLSGSLLSVEMAADGQNGRDPLKQWPVCFATYTVLATVSV